MAQPWGVGQRWKTSLPPATLRWGGVVAEDGPQHLDMSGPFQQLQGKAPAMLVLELPLETFTEPQFLIVNNQDG